MTELLIPAPQTEAELMSRAHQLAGRTVQTIADALEVAVPSDPRRSKGFTGVLLELALGANAGSRPVPDFEALGIELKTIPVSPTGKPVESTYVCTVPLHGRGSVHWEESNVKCKLNRVLWIPVITAPEGSVGRRKIGPPLLWSPSSDEERGLRADWEELMDKVVLGEVASITARMGTWLQIRPKAANARARQWGIEISGAPVETLPRGFYLRTLFTQKLLHEHCFVPE